LCQRCLRNRKSQQRQLAGKHANGAKAVRWL
jgi:hypothetical protein